MFLGAMDSLAMELTLRDLDQPHRRSHFSFREFDQYQLPMHQTLLRVHVEDGHSYDLWVMGDDGSEGVGVVVRALHEPKLCTPRPGLYLQVVGKRKLFTGRIESGSAMLFQCVSPHGGLYEHQSAAVRHQGIATIPMGEVEPFRDAALIYAEMISLSGDDDGDTTTWAFLEPLLPSAGRLVMRRICSFDPPVANALQEILEFAYNQSTETLKKVVNSFNFYYQAYWGRQSDLIRRPTDTSLDENCFRRLRSLAGMPGATTTR